MANIIRKEIKLSASCLSFIFILFGLMFFLPGYPVLCGAFFISLGIFQSFRNARESNDILFSALLPIAKHDVVKGKYLFVCFIELCGILLMAVVVLIRMTLLVDAGPYTGNALMNANLFALAMAFVIFGLFNSIFVGGFFKTAYNFGRPFIFFIVIAFIVITFAEALHHFPGFDWVNAFGTDHLGAQVLMLAAGMILFALMTFVSYNISCKRFERIDL